MAALPVPPATSSTREPAAGSTLSTRFSATMWMSAAITPKSPLAHMACCPRLTASRSMVRVGVMLVSSRRPFVNG
jgi:hypothetical protein